MAVERKSPGYTRIRAKSYSGVSKSVLKKVFQSIHTITQKALLLRIHDRFTRHKEVNASFCKFKVSARWCATSSRPFGINGYVPVLANVYERRQDDTSRDATTVVIDSLNTLKLSSIILSTTTSRLQKCNMFEVTYVSNSFIQPVLCAGACGAFPQRNEQLLMGTIVLVIVYLLL